MSDSILKNLRERGFRITPQRLVILRVLQEAGGHLSPTEIYQRASELLPGLTEATVYRTLSFLTEQNVLLCAHVGSGQMEYEFGDLHHHLICRKCGASVQIEDQVIQALYAQLQGQTGYCLDGRHVTLFGLCPQCQGGG